MMCSTVGKSLPPSRKRVVEGALTRGALFNRDDGTALVGVDERHVEPGTLLRELDVASAVGVDIGEADQEEAVGDSWSVSLCADLADALPIDDDVAGTANAPLKELVKESRASTGNETHVHGRPYDTNDDGGFHLCHLRPDAGPATVLGFSFLKHILGHCTVSHCFRYRPSRTSIWSRSFAGANLLLRKIKIHWR
jgi:hypothetical protein